MAVLFSCFFGDGKKRGWCIISHCNVMNKGNIRLTRSSFWRFVSSRMWRKRCMEQGRCRWVDRPSKEHETFCKYICCEPKERCEKKTGGERTTTNLRTVWPSTPVCSKFIPAEPSAHTMIWSYQKQILYLFSRRQTQNQKNIPYHTTYSYMSQPVRLLASCKSRIKSCYTNPRDYPERYHPNIQQKAHYPRCGDMICYVCLRKAWVGGLTRPCGFQLREHRWHLEQPRGRNERKWKAAAAYIYLRFVSLVCICDDGLEVT